MLSEFEQPGHKVYWEGGGGVGVGVGGREVHFSPSSKRGISVRMGVWTFKGSLYHTP